MNAITGSVQATAELATPAILLRVSYIPILLIPLLKNHLSVFSQSAIYSSAQGSAIACRALLQQTKRG